LVNTPAASRAVIDLGAYAHNLGVVRHRIPRGCGLMAVVKTNAYGLGSVPIARRAVAEGVDMLGVATVEEGATLRAAGIEAPILVLCQPERSALGAVIEHRLRVMLSNVTVAERLGELARRANRVVPIHCKVDSGMGRQGFALDEALDALRHLTRISHIDIEGIATHFPVAEVADDAFTANQIRAFKQALKQIAKAGIPYEMAHAANSAAVVNYPDSAFDLVRPGLMTYGAWPTATPPSPMPLRPVLRWESRVTLVKAFDSGASIGYGRTYTTDGRMRAAVVPVGYADGYRYRLANRADALVRGKRCPVRGNVSMDQIVIDVTELDGVQPGDAVTLLGTDGDETITVEELAAHAETVSHDILAGLGARVTREYIE